MPADGTALILRADAGPEIGAGHVVRTLALASALRSPRATLMTFAPSEFVRSQAAEAGVRVEAVAAAFPDPGDLAGLLAAIGAEGSPWVVLDGYLFDQTYQAALRAKGARVLVLDDGPRLTSYEADLVLDQNLGAETRNYPGIPPERQLLGSRYALLRRKVIHIPAPIRRFDIPAKRWLITFGGADPMGMIPRVVQALAACPTPAEIVVVAGPQNPRLASIQAVAADDPRVRVEAAADVPALMRWADAAVISAGSSSWEAAYLALPCLVFSAVENQVPIAEALSSAGAAIHLDTTADAAAISAAIEDLALNGPARCRLSRAAGTLVDGLGAERVAAAMYAPAGGST